MGDDLGDWEDDLKAGNNTVLLRQCYLRTKEEMPDMDEVLRILFIDGVYEQFVAEMIQRLDRASLALASSEPNHSKLAVGFIQTARAKAVSLLEGVVEGKLNVLQGEIPS
jgi:hypothetical protein